MSDSVMMGERIIRNISLPPSEKTPASCRHSETYSSCIEDRAAAQGYDSVLSKMQRPPLANEKVSRQMEEALTSSLISEAKKEAASNHLLTPLANAIGLKSAYDLRALTFMSMYFATFALLWQRGESLGWLPCICVQLSLCWLAFCCATIIHNTIHWFSPFLFFPALTFFDLFTVSYMFPMSYRWTNSLVFWALTLCYGHPVSSFVPGHNQSHHRFTQLRKDLMRTSKLRHDWNLLNFFFYQPTVLRAVLVSDIEYALLQRALGKPFFRKMIGEYFLLFLVSVPLIILSPLKWILYFQVIAFPSSFSLLWDPSSGGAVGNSLH